MVLRSMVRSRTQSFDYCYRARAEREPGDSMVHGMFILLGLLGLVSGSICLAAFVADVWRMVAIPF